MATIQSGLDASACVYVAKNMRLRDRHEIGAMFPGFDEVSFGLGVYHAAKANAAWSATAYLDRPVAIVSLTHETPRCLQATMFATDEFPSVALRLTRHMLKIVKPDLVSRGINRIEARCWEGHTNARKWLSLLGAREELAIPGYGANGETFIQMAWSTHV